MLDPEHTLVMIKGGGDLASGVAVRLHRCGFPVVMTELPNPLMVRRSVSFGEAVFTGTTEVEGITACRAMDINQAQSMMTAGKIPVIIDPRAICLACFKPPVLIDAIIAKHNTGTQITDAPLVIALGPGFTAGIDCHVVIETNRGYDLGRPIYVGSAEPDTGQPGEIAGKSNERLLRAPTSGIVENLVEIGYQVCQGQLVARVNGCDVHAGTSGIVRGLIRSGSWVNAGLKIGDIDPRAQLSHCYLTSDKSLAIAGGVLEAILAERVTQKVGRFHFQAV
ncbi:MAG: selenium-dependent molybdenum cofactor biosynthesis protein YqeB [Anaerolineaceae bacterium]|nr:selenium-dependent molybdenum cofactor biosynthesis protein YqeB [Anaerolineaceae bacterium]